MIDLDRIKQNADLLAICGVDTNLKRVATTGGGEWAGPCPMCGGRDRFRVQPGAGRWLCRTCTDGKWQDVISYIQRRDTCDFKAAIRTLTNGNIPNITQPRRPSSPKPADMPPVDNWQAAVRQIIDQCSARLWAPEGHKALEYLRGRGLSEKTIKNFRLGVSTGKDIAGLQVWRGIVIPGIIAGNIWYLKVRISPDLITKGWDKYLCVTGSKPKAIFNADALLGADVGIVAEGEFDCMTIHQELRGIPPCVTFGSATNSPDLATWGAYLLPLRLILSCYHADDQGEKAEARLIEIAGDRVRLTNAPSGKDVNDYFIMGGDLNIWIMGELAFHDDRLMDQTIDAARALGGVLVEA